MAKHLILAPVTTAAANNVYGVGSSITLHVAFDENVIVDVTGGSPRLQLETGVTDRYAVFSGGSGTKVLSFTYTVQPGDQSSDLDIFSSSALTLNGSTIRDAAGNNAVLTLASPGTAGSLAANANLVIDAYDVDITGGTGSDGLVAALVMTAWMEQAATTNCSGWAARTA